MPLWRPCFSALLNPNIMDSLYMSYMFSHVYICYIHIEDIEIDLGSL